MYGIVWNYGSEGWKFHEERFQTAADALSFAMEDGRESFKIVCEIDFVDSRIVDCLPDWEVRSVPLRGSHEIKFQEKLSASGADAAAQTNTHDSLTDGFHSMDDLYAHRHALFGLLSSILGGWKAKKHSDGTSFDGWFIAGITLPTGQITYHLPSALWETFPAVVHESAPPWDGHDSETVLTRIQEAWQEDLLALWAAFPE